MRERHRRQTGTDGPAPRSRGTTNDDGWSIPSWITICLLVGVALFFLLRYVDDRRRAVPFPQSGDVHWYAHLEEPAVAPLTLVAPSNVKRSFAVRLDDWESHRPIALIPVRAGDSSVTLLPLGRYRLTIATGYIWQGTDRLFGRDTSLKQAVHPVELFVRGNVTTGRRIELEVPLRGNMEVIPVKP